MLMNKRKIKRFYRKNIYPICIYLDKKTSWLGVCLEENK